MTIDFPEVQRSTQWTPVVRTYGLTPAQRSLYARLRELAALSENWDGYGSPSIQPRTISQATTVLQLLARLPIASPQIFPIAGGGIQFEWQSETAELELEILPDGHFEYLIADSRREMREGRVPEYSDAFICRLVQWFDQPNVTVGDL